MNIYKISGLEEFFILSDLSSKEAVISEIEKNAGLYEELRLLKEYVREAGVELVGALRTEETVLVAEDYGPDIKLVDKGELLNSMCLFIGMNQARIERLEEMKAEISR